MSTTQYLNNAAEIAAAVRAAKKLGYQTTNADIRANDRYVMNVVRRLGGGRDLENAIVTAVHQVRLQHAGH
jgi:hypothetical protein